MAAAVRDSSGECAMLQESRARRRPSPATHLPLLEVPDLVLDYDDGLTDRVHGLRRGLFL